MEWLKKLLGLEKKEEAKDQTANVAMTNNNPAVADETAPGENTGGDAGIDKSSL